MKQKRGGQEMQADTATTTASAVLTEKAYAKINLGLKVLAKRADGFHEICSIFQNVSLADTLQFRPAPIFGMSCSDASLSTGSDNLVTRAAALFAEAVAGRDAMASTYHIHLEKRIPVGAGLGGGSADAAAVLRGLNHLAGEPFDHVYLQGMGAELGSDIPFALVGGTSLVRGRGEILEPLQWARPPCYYALVYPGLEVSTAWAYGQVPPQAPETQALGRLTEASSYLRFIDSLRGGRVDGKRLQMVLENDLQPLVERVNPIVAVVGSQLMAAGAVASSMSGSGSAVYGIFDDRTAAESAAEKLRVAGFRSFCCTPVK